MLPRDPLQHKISCDISVTFFQTTRTPSQGGAATTWIAVYLLYLNKPSSTLIHDDCWTNSFDNLRCPSLPATFLFLFLQGFFFFFFDIPNVHDMLGGRSYLLIWRRWKSGTGTLGQTRYIRENAWNTWRACGSRCRIPRCRAFPLKTTSGCLIRKLGVISALREKNRI